MNLTKNFILFILVSTATWITHTQAAASEMKFINNKSILKEEYIHTLKDGNQSSSQSEDIIRLLREKGLLIGIIDTSNLGLNLIDVIKPVQPQEYFVAIVNRQNDRVKVSCNSSTEVLKTADLFKDDSMSLIFQDKGSLEISCVTGFSNKLWQFPVWGPGVPKWMKIIFNLRFEGVYYTDDPDSQMGLKTRWQYRK